jgi:hypothetical protein
MSGEEWLNADFGPESSDAIIGTPEKAIVRPLTKNLIEAPEKAFKTTFLLRLAVALSIGRTVFPSLPVSKSKRVLYLHGELAPPELKERLECAVQHLPRPLDNFFQGRSLDASLVTEEGKEVVRNIVGQLKPDILVIDPWQSLIAGADENNFKEISGATSFLDKLMEDFRLTVFLAVHQGKNRKRGARGHSSLGAWRDTRFALKKLGTSGLNIDIEPRWSKPLTGLTLSFKAGTVWEGDVPKWTEQQLQMRECVKRNGGSVPREAIGEALQLEGSGLRTALMRALGNGAVDLSGDLVKLPEESSSIPESPHPPI